MKYMTHTIILVALLAAASAAQGNLNSIFELSSSANSQFGNSIAILGDLNGDGHAEVLVGSPKAAATGQAYVYSGADASVLYTFSGGNAGDDFGQAVGNAGDVNGDGIDDIIIGAPRATLTPPLPYGRAYVRSGSDGSLLFTITADLPFDSTGWSVDTAGDVNGDGFADVIVGEPGFDAGPAMGAGRIRVFLGPNGAFHKAFTGSAGNRCGSAVAATHEDFDGDGFPDLIASEIGDGSVSSFVGRVRLISGNSGFLITTIPAPPGSGIEFGFALASGTDVDSDGTMDILVGAPQQHPLAMLNAGRAFVYSGANLALLHTFSGSSTEHRLGTSIAAAGDINGDGIQDLIVGVPGISTSGGSTGVAQIYSGNDFSLLRTVAPSSPRTDFASSVAGGGDIDNDGIYDVVAGTPSGGFGFTTDPSVEAFAGAHPRIGSREDFRMKTGVNDSESSIFLKDAAAGDSLLVSIASENGGYDFEVPLLAAQLSVTGTALTQPAGFSEAWVNPSPFAPFPVLVLYNGDAASFGPAVLPPGGLNFVYQIPNGLSGHSINLQALVLAPSANTGNPFFTASDGMEIRVQ